VIDSEAMDMPSGGFPRLLFFHYGDDHDQAQAGTFSSFGYEVVDADPFDLHWTKMVSGSAWAAIVIDLACLGEIAVEIAAELEQIPEGMRPPILLVGSEELGWESLPTPLRSARRLADYNELEDALSGLPR